MPVHVAQFFSGVIFDDVFHAELVETEPLRQQVTNEISSSFDTPVSDLGRVAAATDMLMRVRVGRNLADNPKTQVRFRLHVGSNPSGIQPWSYW